MLTLHFGGAEGSFDFLDAKDCVAFCTPELQDSKRLECQALSTILQKGENRVAFAHSDCVR